MNLKVEHTTSEMGSMSVELNEDTINEIEHALAELTDVEAVRIVSDGSAINEIHILSEHGRAPKQIVRDVESVLMARFFISVDHKKISIAQITSGKTSSTEVRAIEREELDIELPDRLLISSISTEISNNYIFAKVSLMFAGVSYEGIANGINTQSAKNRLLAQATLNCVSEISTDFVNTHIDDISISTISGKKLFCVCLSQVKSSGEELVCGSALVRTDEKEAVVRAVLDAINRRFIISEIAEN